MNQSMVELSPGFQVCSDFANDLKTLGLNTLDAIFAFKGGTTLFKKELTSWRSRVEFVLPHKNIRCFLKRYDQPPILMQMKNWLNHRKRCLTAYYDVQPCHSLNQAGIGTYQVIAFGGRWRGLWEEKSFAILREIPDAQSLEKKLPDYFSLPISILSHKQRQEFLNLVADFIRRFRDTGYCHRDLYLCHIFRSRNDALFLIDLQRAFMPKWFRDRWILKDLSQLYYSAPGDIISRTDRLRFYLRYTQKSKLEASDRRFIRRLKRRAWRMADHDIRRGNEAPFAK